MLWKQKLSHCWNCSTTSRSMIWRNLTLWACRITLTKLHGDYVMPNGGSFASEGLALGGHLGTHIDALCHFSCGGKLHGGHDVAAAQSYSSGLKQLSVDTLSPIVRRGVLLDIAGQQNLASLPAAFEITPEHMEKAAHAQTVEIQPGDV